MQAEEIQRLQASSSMIGAPIGINKESVLKLTEKVDQLRFSYLEKDREV
jgi:hypothetical protein